MKKVLPLILVICCLCLAACSPNTSEQETTFGFDFSKAVGLTQEKALKELKISEDLLEETNQEERYNMKEPVTFSGVDFTKYLLFVEMEPENTILFGGGYEYVTVNDDEISEKFEAVKAELERLYGEPMPHSVSGYTYDTEDSSKYTAESFKMEWQPKDENCVIGAEISTSEKEARIKIQYEIKPELYLFD